MTYADFQRELAHGQIRPAYCFVGDEDFLADEGTQAVTSAVLPAGERSFALIQLGPGSGGAEVRSALFAPSFFGGKRMVLIRDCGKMDPDAQEMIARSLAGLPTGTHVALRGVLDNRRGATKSILANAVVVDCPVPKRGEAIAWALARAGTHGLELAPDAARLLVERVGPHLGRIESELEKALTYLGGERRNLTAVDLNALLGREPTDDVFQLVEAAGSGRVEEALRTLADLLDLGEPEGRLLVLMARQVRQILLAGYLREAGKKSAEIATTLGVPGFVAEKLLRQASRLSFDACVALLAKMHRADLLSKTGERDPRLALDLTVLAMAGRV